MSASPTAMKEKKKGNQASHGDNPEKPVTVKPTGHTEAARSRQATDWSAGPRREGGRWADDALPVAPSLQDGQDNSRAEAQASVSE